MTRQQSVTADRLGRTELHYACADANVDLARKLIQGGANHDLADSHGWTPLHFAAQAQAADLVALLLATGATPDPIDSNGNTPLWTAVLNSHGRGAIIEQLRAAGADPYRLNNHGVSPLSLARTIANYDVARYFGDLPEGT